MMTPNYLNVTHIGQDVAKKVYLLNSKSKMYALLTIHTLPLGHWCINGVAVRGNNTLRRACATRSLRRAAAATTNADQSVQRNTVDAN